MALLAIALLTLAFPQAAAADDDDPPGRVARLNYIQGPVSFEPAGESDWVSAFTNRPVTTGDRIWADPGGRAELNTGSATIRLDGGTGFSFLNLDDRTVQIQLTEGTLDIRVKRLDSDEIFEVDTPNQAFSILRPGRYRVQASEDGNSTYVIVRSGEGEATGGGQVYTMHSGQSGTFTGTDSLYADIYDAGDPDDFDNWGDGRDRRYEESQSARYVSPDVVGYEDLDDYGSWRSDPDYGNVWVPTRVNSGWAPYREGHWAWISPWGWTWVDDAPWGYAPFHYGRWVSLRGNWGWVPGPREVRSVYAPALVVFIGGPQFGGGGGYGGNVGWFPLGPREVYVPSYNVSRGYVERVNVSNTTVSRTTITTIYNNQITNNITNTNITYVNRTVRGGVTAVPQRTFSSAQPVARAAVAVNAQEIAAAPVTRRAAVAPTRNSVLGPSAPAANRVAQPPVRIANRSVVAKAPPPPPPVAFEKQQQALAAHPGQPLARHEVESLRPTNVVAERPRVRQAPPGKPATPNTNRPNGQPAVGNSRQPASAPPSNAPANKAAGTPEATAPAQRPQPTRKDRPPSAQQQADQTREQQQADKAREQQANRQQEQKAREQQGNRQQEQKAREQEATQQQERKAHEQQATQQEEEKARERDQAQQQTEKARERDAAQQQAEKARERDAAQQQAEKARERDAAQQQAEKARERDAAQQQERKAREQQAAQQQEEKARERQANQPRPDRPPTAQPGERPKPQPAQPPETKPKRPLTKAERDREEHKKQEEKPPPQ